MHCYIIPLGPSTVSCKQLKQNKCWLNIRTQWNNQDEAKEHQLPVAKRSSKHKASNFSWWNECNLKIALNKDKYNHNFQK